MPRRSQNHRGVITVELTMALPILLILFLAVIEFAMLLIARQSLSHASYVGARRGSISAASDADVAEAVRGVLGRRLTNQLDVQVDLGVATGDSVRVSVAVPMRAAAPDLLRWIGLSLSGRELRAETVLRRE